MFLTSSWLDLYAGFSKSLLSNGFFLFSFFELEDPLSISFRMGFVLQYSFSVGLLEKFLISPSI